MGRAGRTPTSGALAPPAGMQILHESERTRVTRLFLADNSVVRKEPLGPGAQKRLRHEVEILQRLAGVSGVSRMARAQSYPGSILLDDLGGVSLAEAAMPLETDDLIRVALSLARVVGGVHGHGVVHRDIHPGNVVMSGAHGAPCLIDFALATTFAEIRLEFTHHNQIVGTLPYLAPEQTGRTGRPVDQRADLYALGATLYELATGHPPFGTNDPLRLVHAHLARVPPAPAEVNREVSPGMSAIIMHLLEKEPDNRYQSADGLAHDLSLLCDGAALPRVGVRDIPLRLLAPSRLVGRQGEIAALSETFAEVLSARSRGVLISGPPGVGKSSLIDELRAIATASDGWFVSGKFDEHRRDLEFDGVRQAFRALGRLLLAEPEEELAALRERMLRALGPNAGLVAAVLPEFAALLRVPGELGDPMTAQVRAQREAVEMLRAIASRERPVVFVVDDLQWAGRTPLGFVDLVFSGDQEIDGLLLVSAYREDEVNVTHALTPLLSRWQRLAKGPVHLRLDNLPASDLSEMLADMLRLDPERAGDLATAIAPHTLGNPYDTVELVNALRHGGVLAARDGGWHWDQDALSGHGRTDVAELLALRAETMPPMTRTLLEAMACLAGRVELALLGDATGLRATVVDRWLAPALEDGLLVLEPGGREAVRFRHDRVREAVLSHLGAERQRAVRLRLARNLVRRPELYAVAALQYLPVVDAVTDPDERRTVVGVLRRAAEQAKLLSGQALVERLLTPAIELADPIDVATVIEMQTDRHAALYGLGRLDEADDAYRVIDRLCTEPRQRTDATLVQISSLTNRNQSREAIDLGLDQLQRIGLAMPTPERLGDEIERGLDAVYRWVEESTDDEDRHRPEITDPTMLAIGALINRIMPPAFFVDQATMAWLALEASRIWAEHGPGRTLLGPVSHVPYVLTAMRDDRRTGYRLMQRVLATGETRGYEPDTSQARFLFGLGACHWFEPIEGALAQVLRAREGLIRGGDLANACHTYYASTYAMLDSSPSLDSYVPEVESALAFAARTANDHDADAYRAYRRLVSVLRGEPVESPDEEAPYLDRLAGNPTAEANVHITRALAGALLNDPKELRSHAAAAMPLLPFVESTYPTAVAHLLWSMDLAAQIRAAAPDARKSRLAELDSEIAWLAARAADAPLNFGHLLRLVEAERAWAIGDFRAACVAFDTVVRESATRRRPWHRALVFERTARFFLAHGMEHVGYTTLATARQAYQVWGATAKVAQLDWAYPTLRSVPDRAGDREPGQSVEATTHRSNIMTGAIDLLGILAASQAISSETSIDGLRARVADVLSAMTGATGVHLLLWSEDDRNWLLTTPAVEGGTISLGDAGRRRVPLSVIRYAERTREPVVVDDATHDDRFARDPYFLDLDSCSLLAVPIFNRGALQALLLLENRLIRGAFSAEHLDGVKLAAGQLTVSLANALVYASLEGKVAERTHQLAQANDRLEQLSITDPLTGLANRRRLEEVVIDQWRRAERTREPLGLAMVDIDHFKLYNDNYGHAAGDRCLQRVTAELNGKVRPLDLVARYGGEEFAVVMPGADVDTAQVVAERLRTAVASLAEPHRSVPEQIVTISVGVASMVPPPGGLVENLVEQADVELYRAKRAGRNCVRAAPPQPH